MREPSAVSDSEPAALTEKSPSVVNVLFPPRSWMTKYSPELL